MPKRRGNKETQRNERVGRKDLENWYKKGGSSSVFYLFNSQGLFTCVIKGLFHNKIGIFVISE
jgi:hypothetical protein